MFPSKFLQFPSILTHFHAANEKIQNGGRDLAISRGLVFNMGHRPCFNYQNVRGMRCLLWVYKGKWQQNMENKLHKLWPVQRGGCFMRTYYGIIGCTQISCQSGELVFMRVFTHMHSSDMLMMMYPHDVPLHVTNTKKEQIDGRFTKGWSIVL